MDFRLTEQQRELQDAALCCQGDAGVRHCQGRGTSPVAHAQNHEPHAKYRRHTKQKYCGKDHELFRIRDGDSTLGSIITAPHVREQVDASPNIVSVGGGRQPGCTGKFGQNNPPKSAA